MKIATVLVGAGVAAALAYKLGYLDQFLPADLDPVSPITPEPSNPAVAAPNTKGMVLAAAGGGSPMLSFDAWNAFYRSVRGINGPDPNDFLTVSTRSQNLSIEEWWNYMGRAGFSGIVRMWPTAPINPFVREPGSGRWN